MSLRASTTRPESAPGRTPRPERAGRLLAAARYVGGAANLPIPFRTPASWALYRHYLPLVRAALGPDEARRAREEGRAMTFEGALAYGLVGTDVGPGLMLRVRR